MDNLALEVPYQATLTSVSKKPPTVEETIISFITNRECGNQAFQKCNYAVALSHYHRAEGKLARFIRWTDHTFVVSDGEFAGMSRSEVEANMDMQIESLIIAVLIKQGAFTKAERRAKLMEKAHSCRKFESCRINREYPGDYWVALVQEGRGDLFRSVKTMAKALKVIPTSEKIRAKYRRLRQQATETKKREDALTFSCLGGTH